MASSTQHSSLYNLRLFDSTGEEEYFLKEYCREVHGDSGSPLKELTLAQFIEDQAVQARASSHLLLTFDHYSLMVGILLALMMVLPALYTYYYKYDQYSFVLRNARKAAKVEVTNSFETHEMNNFKPASSRSNVITIQEE